MNNTIPFWQVFLDFKEDELSNPEESIHFAKMCAEREECKRKNPEQLYMTDAYITDKIKKRWNNNDQ